jgi:hypothetical protein
MSYRLTTAVVVLAFTANGVGCPGVGQASPGGQCTWTPVPPTIVDVSNVKMVQAALKRGACTLEGNPSGETICLSIQSEGSAGQCSTSMSDPAQIQYKYVPGATYVLTGRGCVNIYEAPYKLCQTFGPSYYTM